MAPKNKAAKTGSTKPKLGVIIAAIVVLLAVVPVSGVLAFAFSPDMYAVTTARWTEWDAENTGNVKAAMGEENTEERFRLYFQYYNVIHELGHGLLRYNHGTDLPIAEEEQLVNDFAVAYWNYYGEPEKMEELYDIVTYAVDHVGENTQNGVDYMELAKENSSHSSFKKEFFNFNDYGWFQFSSVKHSIEQNRSLEDVLKDMGCENAVLPEKTILVHTVINEEESTAIINEAVQNFNEWGLVFPQAYQSFNDDPNNNYSSPSKNFLGLIK